MIDDLESDQPQRQKVQPEVYEKIEQVISKIKLFINCDPNTVPLTVTVDDPAGNSWIEYVQVNQLINGPCTNIIELLNKMCFGLISADDVAQHRQAELANKSKPLIQTYHQT